MALASPDLARAQSAAQIAAEARFTEGVRLMKADRCEAALTEFRASQALDPASGTLLDIGYCEVRLGHVASAWFAYRQALSLAQASRKEHHERIARRELDALEPQLAYWSLRVPAGSADVSVEVDGSRVEREVWSAGTPADPGAHQIRVFERGAPKWERSFSLVAGQRLVLDVPGEAFAARAPEVLAAPRVSETAVEVPMSPAGVGAREPSQVASAAREVQRHDARRILALSSAGAGAACLLGAGILFAKARHDYDAVDEDCPSNVCRSKSSYEARNGAIDLFHWSLGVGGVGVALLGVGSALLLSSRASADVSVARSISFQLDARKAELTWRGAF
ncbi:MAG TPA: hypothetical protein VFQ35_09805 [Polyangiaceae bacterium]|nr:hypothetical protein [Polyangiaceae bacterium]